MKYDRMRELKVEEITTDAEGNESANVISHHRFIYRGYLQIACCDLTRNAHPCLWLITWDPTQPVATRPLAIQKDGTWFCYGWDLTKNICEVFGQNGYIRTAYSYTPYGSVTANGDITQPIQWSSEYADTDLALVYYNYRHYNPMDGRWIGRDPIGGNHLYHFVNNSILNIDLLGTISTLTIQAKYVYKVNALGYDHGQNSVMWHIQDGYDIYEQVTKNIEYSFCCDGNNCKRKPDIKRYDSNIKGRGYYDKKIWLQNVNRNAFAPYTKFWTEFWSDKSRHIYAIIIPDMVSNNNGGYIIDVFTIGIGLKEPMNTSKKEIDELNKLLIDKIAGINAGIDIAFDTLELFRNSKYYYNIPDRAMASSFLSAEIKCQSGKLGIKIGKQNAKTNMDKFPINVKLDGIGYATFSVDLSIILKN